MRFKNKPVILSVNCLHRFSNARVLEHTGESKNKLAGPIAAWEIIKKKIAGFESASQRASVAYASSSTPSKFCPILSAIQTAFVNKRLCLFLVWRAVCLSCCAENPGAITVRQMSLFSCYYTRVYGHPFEMGADINN